MSGSFDTNNRGRRQRPIFVTMAVQNVQSAAGPNRLLALRKGRDLYMTLYDN